MADIDDIKIFFEKVAEHPIIGHKHQDKDRFFGYNFDELPTGERSVKSFPCLGLADRTNSSLSGNFKANETHVETNQTIHIVVLDKAKSIDQEEKVYSQLFEMLLDFVLWLHDKTASGQTCPYPFLKKIDLARIDLIRIGSASVSGAIGYKLSMPLKQRKLNYPNNPLNSIL